MLIPITLSGSKLKKYLPHQLVLTIERDPQSVLETIVGTTIQNPSTGGFIAFRSVDSPEEIAQLVNSAIIEELQASRRNNRELN